MLRKTIDNTKKYENFTYNEVDIMTYGNKVKEEFRDEFEKIRQRVGECNRTLEVILKEEEKLQKNVDKASAALMKVRDKIDWNSDVPKAVAKEQREAEKRCSEALVEINDKILEEKRVRVAISKLYRRANALLLS